MANSRKQEARALTNKLNLLSSISPNHRESEEVRFSHRDSPNFDSADIDLFASKTREPLSLLKGIIQAGESYEN